MIGLKKNNEINGGRDGEMNENICKAADDEYQYREKYGTGEWGWKLISTILFIL